MFIVGHGSGKRVDYLADAPMASARRPTSDATLYVAPPNGLADALLRR
jgi:hypothetical protein